MTSRFEPFAGEFTSGCDWIEWASATSVRTPEREAAVRRWKQFGEANESVRAAFPENFLCSIVVRGACSDLADAISVGSAVSLHRSHSIVNACAHQFGDPVVRAVGFGLPVLIPDVTRLDWPDVVEARHHPGLVRLREELTELEAIAFVRNDEDVEAAIRREFDRA